MSKATLTRPASSTMNGASNAQEGAPPFDWLRIVRTLLLSRALDELEEKTLLPAKQILYQFSARGHELGQILLGTLLTGRYDAVSGYYRSRPLLLTLGLSATDALKGGMAKSGGINDGRDIGVVFNFHNPGGPTVLPMAGGVGTQYSPAAGWAHAIRFYSESLGDVRYRGSIGVVCGGDGSVATNGFWSALNVAATRRLPLFFFIEDNGYGLSVPAELQTPGGNIAMNLRSFSGLRVDDVETTDPAIIAAAIRDVVSAVRAGSGPALLRLTMPRLSGHSGQDTQSYKPHDLLADEQARDPLTHLRSYMVPEAITHEQWAELEDEASDAVNRAYAEASAAPDPVPSRQHAVRYVFAEEEQNAATPVLPQPEPTRSNMIAAIRRTLEYELRTNPKLLIFGEDVGAKGGVHTATMSLQKTFGADRVFDSSLSEEGIVGNAVGMALAGLRPVVEIQFRKYAEPATEQLNDCGSMRWRTANRFSAPIVVRIPGGFSLKCGDPWHSMSNEVAFAHAVGWQMIYPSNAEDATGLLRAAMRSPNPSIFFEHRALLDSSWARRPYPGDAFVLPLGVARTVQSGSDLTVVTWGAMVERCLLASARCDASVEVIDLRCIAPWDRETVSASVKRTSRCLIVHEDTMTAGFGAEIAAVIAREAFLWLDAPVERMAVPDIPMPYNVGLMQAVLPSIDSIAEQMKTTVNF